VHSLLFIVLCSRRHSWLVQFDYSHAVVEHEDSEWFDGARPQHALMFFCWSTPYLFTLTTKPSSR
jgi:hypothetical protein